MEAQRGCQSEAGQCQESGPRDLVSEFSEVDLVTGAREASVVLEVEQNIGTTQWGMWKTFRQVLAELKKQQRESGPLATDAHGTKYSLNNCLHQPHYTSPDPPPPLVTSSTSAATTPRSGASRPPRTPCRRRRGRRAKRRQQARALDAQEAGREGAR
jgi:hypothetical protein